jgi:hypothetical protein
MWKDRATQKIRPIARSGLCNIDHSNSAMSSGRPRPSTLHKPELTALHTTSAERYLTLARAEAVVGDLVGAENYNQFPIDVRGPGTAISGRYASGIIPADRSVGCDLGDVAFAGHHRLEQIELFGSARAKRIGLSVPIPAGRVKPS